MSVTSGPGTSQQDTAVRQHDTWGRVGRFFAIVAMAETCGSSCRCGVGVYRTGKPGGVVKTQASNSVEAAGFESFKLHPLFS